MSNASEKPQSRKEKMQEMLDESLGALGRDAEAVVKIIKASAQLTATIASILDDTGIPVVTNADGDEEPIKLPWGWMYSREEKKLYHRTTGNQTFVGFDLAITHRLFSDAANGFLVDLMDKCLQYRRDTREAAEHQEESAKEGKTIGH